MNWADVQQGKGASYRWAFWTTFALLAGLASAVWGPQEISRWHFAAALAFHDEGQVDQAWASLQRAADWNAKDPQLYLQRAKWHSDAQRYQEALQDCDQAIDLDPYEAAAYLTRTDIFHQQGLYRKALQDCDLVVQLYENYYKPRPVYWTSQGWQPLSPYNNRAYAKALADVDIEGGLRDIAISLKKHGHLPSLLDTRAFLRYRQGKYEEGLADMNAAIPKMQQQLDRVTRREDEDWPRTPTARDALKAFKRMVAVLYYHRMLIHQKMNQSELAEQDRQRVESLGESPGERLY